jgi:hypothetical protein
MLAGPQQSNAGRGYGEAGSRILVCVQPCATINQSTETIPFGFKSTLRAAQKQQESKAVVTIGVPLRPHACAFISARLFARRKRRNQDSSEENDRIRLNQSRRISTALVGLTTQGISHWLLSPGSDSFYCCRYSHYHCILYLYSVKFYWPCYLGVMRL